MDLRIEKPDSATHCRAGGARLEESGSTGGSGIPRILIRRGCAFWLVLGAFLADSARAQDTVNFSYSGVGVTKAMTEWGVDTAWPDPDNVRQSIYHMGAGQAGVVRINLIVSKPPDSNVNLGKESRQRVNPPAA